MTARFDTPPPVGTAFRGGAPVGHLDELPTLEVVAIMFLRMWCDGGANRDRMMQDLVRALGPQDADTANAIFDELMRLTLSCARRPFMRHGVPCRCFGGDECAFANLLGAAVSGDKEEAMLFSSILINGQAAFPVMSLAHDLSPFLLRFVRATQAANALPPAGSTRH